MSNEQIATHLMQMAAKRSVETQFGWAHPDCEALQEAARILRGEPEKADDGRAPGVLSHDDDDLPSDEAGTDELIHPDSQFGVGA